MTGIIDLVDLLSHKTEEGKLRWQFEGFCVSAHQGNSIIEIYVPAWLGSENDSRIVVRNLNGVVLDQHEFGAFTEEGRHLTRLFERARRDALGVDKALDELRSSLMRL